MFEIVNYIYYLRISSSLCTPFVMCYCTSNSSLRTPFVMCYCTSNSSLRTPCVMCYCTSNSCSVFKCSECQWKLLNVRFKLLQLCSILSTSHFAFFIHLLLNVLSKMLICMFTYEDNCAISKGCTLQTDF